MQRRDFMLKAASLAVAGVAVAGCTTTGNSANRAKSPETQRGEIDAGVDNTLSRLYHEVRGSHDLVAKANGILVFPSVINAGFIVGAQYGKGALRVHGETTGYYSIAAGSVGLLAGAQSKSLVFLFLTRDALDRFRNSSGWTVGADASVAVLKVGANGTVDNKSISGAVVAFAMTNAGLMADLSLAGTKITPLNI
jgi:lipid-binding SYLF domain-containing protein